ncbi:MAG TPA: hypothetical protein VHI53_05710 [Gaiellaceae bacterium]|nr:hypothetical protein [Gaiellaceae bacterium]
MRSLKRLRAGADSESDSRLGTDGNQPGLEHREGAADDVALLISHAQIEIASADFDRAKTFEALASKARKSAADSSPSAVFR